jgi:phospholipid-binding lipoprotein MlaA
MALTTIRRFGFLGLIAAPLFAISPVLADEKTEDPVVEAENDNDPLESLNRFTHGFNQVVRGVILDPLVDGYQAVTPDFLQEAVGNAASNLTEPVTAVSSFLQGDTENAGNATKRFLLNSTVGLGGINDPATEAGIIQRREDLGQAAAVNGADEGMYIVLPLLGPSNSRDALGDALTAVASPMPLLGAVAQGGVQYSGNQDDIQALSKGALDPYVVERDAYSQYRKFQINNGDPDPLDGPTLEAGDLQ